MAEGVWNIRCPGQGCCYHMVDEDVKLALTHSEIWECALNRYSQLRNLTDRSQVGSCGSRFLEVLTSAMTDGSQAWVLQQCQACPRCLVLAREEDGLGCSHLVCRCGCDFCFDCGAPLLFRLCSRCDCDLRHEVGPPYFGAWLSRANPHQLVSESDAFKLFVKMKCAWLPSGFGYGMLAKAHAAETARAEELQRRGACAAFGFWLWHAGADVESFPPGTDESFLQSYWDINEPWYQDEAHTDSPHDWIIGSLDFGGMVLAPPRQNRRRR